MCSAKKGRNRWSTTIQSGTMKSYQGIHWTKSHRTLGCQRVGKSTDKVCWCKTVATLQGLRMTVTSLTIYSRNSEPCCQNYSKYRNRSQSQLTITKQKCEHCIYSHNINIMTFGRGITNWICPALDLHQLLAKDTASTYNQLVFLPGLCPGS